jgi:hypothetical protein
LEESTSQVTGRPGANKTVLRVAWIIIGAGVLVAMSAAITGGMNPNANVLPIRNLAAVIMLVGLLTVLAAHRAAWLQTAWDKPEQAATVSGPRRQHDLALGLVIFLSILLGGAFLITALLALTADAVSGYAILVLRTMMPVVVVSLLVYGRGYLRTFCIGAIIPAGLQALSAFSLMMLILEPSVWQQAGWAARHGNLVSLVVSGLLTGAAGVVAVIVRFLVEHLQDSDPRGPIAPSDGGVRRG